MDKNDATPTKDRPHALDEDLRQHLDAIRREDVPARLLDLARQLQTKLRGGEDR